MESQNAILLQPPAPGSRGELWKVDENEVENSFCLPAKAAPFSVSATFDFLLCFPSFPHCRKQERELTDLNAFILHPLSASQYNGMLSYDEDGNPASEDSVQEARMKAEGIHGLW